MAEARRRDTWEHTSAMMAAWLGGKPQDFNPFTLSERGRRVALSARNVDELIAQARKKRLAKEQKHNGQ